MPSATRTISIRTTPEEAFAFFADPANDKRWRPGVKEIAASGPPKVGARIRQVVVGPGGRGIAVDIIFSLAAELGFLKGLVLGRPVQSSMDGEMAALDTAKRLLETP